MGFSQSDVEALSAALGEPSWLRERRLEAWGYAEKLDLPREKDEPWRYTDLRRLKFSLDTFAATDPGVSAGSLAIGQLDPAAAERGVVVSSLHDGLASHPEVVQKALFSGTNPGQDVFAALHVALFSRGAFVYVPAGVTVALPIEITHELAAGGVGFFPHDVVVVEEGAEVVVIGRYRSGDLPAASLSDAGVDLVAGPGSRVSYVSLQEYGTGVWHFLNQRATVDRQAVFSSLVVSLGARFSRAQVESALVGEQAELSMMGLYFAEGEQHFDMRTLQDHVAPNCRSDLLYKGALKDHSHTVYSGLIRVHEGAEKTDAYQANRNLVLSDHAKADSKPELEILNNDVRCTHGSTVGQVDEDQLFYLESRGISPEEATRLIVEGFFEDVINRLRVEPVREALHAAIDRKLGV